MKTIMIFGASRGLGLEEVKQYLEVGFQVFATYRDLASSPELKTLSDESEHLTLFQLDITDEASVKILSEKIETPIDILLINAGVLSRDGSLEAIKFDEMVRLFSVNCAAHLVVAKYFLKHVAESDLKQIVSLTSRMGSIEDNSSGRSYAYRASKAADNAVMRSLAIDTAFLGVHVTLYHPGWVKTDMTNFKGNLSVFEAVNRMRGVIETARQFESGSFLGHDGSVLPW